MSSLWKLAGLVSVTGLAVVLAVAVGGADRPAQAGRTAVPTPAPVDTGVRGLVCAAPFELAQAYRHDWSAERPMVAEGWLVVLDVDPALVQPRQSAEPVLQMGDFTLERVNAGTDSGRLVAIVPRAVDLADAPAFFGAPALPELVDAAARARERADAVARGAAAFGADAVAAALACGGEKLELTDRRALLEVAAQWILEHAPDEADKAHRLMRLPPPR